MMNPHHIKQAFGQALKTLRINSGLSQEKLAELADLHRTYLGDVERGERNISLVNMWRIAHALRVKLTDLIKEMEKVRR